MAANNQPPVVIKRVKKAGYSEYHSGQWKVAFADFVTAMMAFFLLLWLLNSTTEEQMVGIANYFSPTAASESESGAGGVLGGTSMLAPGAMKTPLSRPGTTVSLVPLDDEPDRTSKRLPGQPQAGENAPDEANTEKLLQEIERQRFEQAKKALRQAVVGSPQLAKFSENLHIDMTPMGMRIQIADAEERSMFPLGSSDMYDYTKTLLRKVVHTIKPLPNDIAVIGHTDARPYRSDNGYTNWELSTDRANASRRVLVAAGLPQHRIVRVVGRADNEPLDKDNPYSPQNRRISILLLHDPAAAEGG